MAVWKSIPDFYEYEASDEGQIRRAIETKTCAGKVIPKHMILKPNLKANGYVEYGLKNDEGIKKYVSGHRLIATTFLGKQPKRGYLVCHNNGIRNDNRVSNLRWATNSENQLDKVGHGTDSNGSKHPFAKLSTEQVCLIIKMWNDGSSQSYIARHFDVVPTTINRIVNGKSYTTETKELLNA
jgi:hypothetical protein